MSSLNKKYQIFISSTYTDLKEERDEVMKAILTHYHIPIGMEMFSAGDDEQWITIQETIDSSDYYVLIIGHRYGSLSKEGISYTEKEFKYALKQNLPIHIFIRDRDVSTSPYQRDVDVSLINKLEKFIKTSTKNRLVSFWKNKEDLALKVMASLNKAFSRSNRIGWVRSDQILNSNSVLEQMAELSKINLSLSNENAELKLNQESQTRKPSFKIIFNRAQNLELSFDDKIYPDNLFIRNGSKSNGYVDKFNAEKLKYLRSNTFKKIVFDITNDGNIKATNIYIDLTFPKQMNAHPLTEKIPSFYHPRDSSTRSIPPTDQFDRAFFNNQTQYLFNSMYDKISVRSSSSDKIVTIFLKELPHTRTFFFNENLIGAIEPLLEGRVKMKIICDELETPIELEYPLTIIDMT